MTQAIYTKKGHILNVGAWCVYDWASGAFPIIVTTFIFATYFTTHVAADKIRGTYEWANATALAGALIALLSPLFGAIADYSGYHKRWLFFFTFICIISTAGLWFAYPSVSYVNLTLLCVIVGTIGLEIALVFYNAFLPHLAPPNYIGRISGWGWGSGYLGGIVALSFVLVFFVQNTPSWINTETAEQIRICGPFAALWYALFSLPFFFIIPESSPTRFTIKQAIVLGWSEFTTTLKTLPSQKNILLYLIAHMIYADGLNTLFAFGGIYAAGTLHFTFTEILLFAITMNVFAGIGAIGLAWVDDYFGSKPTVLFSLVCLTLAGIPLVFLHSKMLFWGLALLLALFIGPVQAASRSLMARLIDPEKATEMFGLYAFSGKITAFIGPWLLGTTTLYFGSQRVGMATILLFFIVGALLLLRVEENKPNNELAN